MVIVVKEKKRPKFDKEQIFNILIREIKDHSIATDSGINSIFRFDERTYEEDGIIGTTLNYTPDNHPQRGTKKKWKEIFRDPFAGFDQQPNFTLAEAYFVWSDKIGRFKSILLFSNNKFFRNHPYNHPDDIKWCKEMLGYLWKRSMIRNGFDFDTVPLPTIDCYSLNIHSVYNSIPIWELCHSILCDDAYSTLFIKLHSKYPSHRIEAIADLAEFNNQGTERVFKRLLLNEKDESVMDALLDAMEKLKQSAYYRSFLADWADGCRSNDYSDLPDGIDRWEEILHKFDR